MDHQKYWYEKLREKFVESFHVVTIALLSFLIPLSFLLLSRLSCAYYFLSLNSNPSSFLFSIIFHINPALVYLIVSIITVLTLVHSLTGKLVVCKPSLFIAWILLWALQICVGLGIQGSITTGIEKSSVFAGERSSWLICRILFFLGLHDTMKHWGKVVVKTVVDDTLFGVVREERWVEKFAVAIGFGSLWWWRVREEVDILVTIVELKKEMMMAVEAADIIGWWLYYLVMIIGMVKIVKGLMWVGVIVFCKKDTSNSVDSCEEEQVGKGDEKV